MNEKPIATIQFKRKVAQRKFEERMVWDRLQQNSPVYNGDTIRTAPESEATIFFADGNIMELGESTMAQVFFHDGVAQTSVQSGEIVVDSKDAKNGAVVSFGESRVELSAGTSLVGTALFDEGGAKIDVMEGNAVFSDASGTVRTLQEGKSLALDSNNQEKIIPLITVAAPRPNEKILNFGGKETQVGFKWNSQNLQDGDFLVLEISSDKKFENIIQKRELKNLNEANVILQNGSFHWRVFPSKAGTTYAAQSKINIISAPKPALILPENNSGYSYKTQSPDVRFLWAQNELVTAFDFEVANNPQMENPQVKQRVSTPSSIVSSLGEGVWYWRVTPFYSMNGIGLATPSEVRSFTISKINSLGAVELILPSSGDTVNTIKNDSVNFSWKNNLEVGEYEILVAQDSNFENIKIQQRQKANFLNVKASEVGMQKGTWFWYVNQFDNEGNFSNKSEVRQFSTAQVEFEQRIIYPPENYSVNSANISTLRFAWKTNVPGDTVFEIARDEKFSDMVLSRISNEQFFQGAKLEGGKYFWRIASKNEPEKYSTQACALHVISPLEKPTLIFPAQNALVPVKQNSNVTFSWNVVGGADYYLVNFYNSRDAKKPFLSERTTSANYSLALGDFENGKYNWSVQAVAEQLAYSPSRSSEIENGSFNIRHVKNLVLSYPPNGTRIDGIDAIEKPGVVRWSSEDERVASSTFTLSHSSNGYSNPIVTIDNPPQEIRLPSLESGTYYWTVRAQNTNGFDISSTPRSFTVNNIAPLAKTRLLGDAANNTVFDAEKIRKSRTINFEWTSVQNATNYIFTLRNERGEVLANHTLGKTKLQFDDIVNFGNGRYTWSVQPIQNGSGGKILRRGEVSTGAFVIKLPEIEEIIIDDTGILYGI